jgi:putative ABC transport system permease protein
MLLANNRRPTRLLLADTIAVARDTALGDRLRFGLTSLGMLIGTASLMLVTTFSLAGKDYVLHEIRSLGSNWISAEHPVVGGKSNAWSDNLTLDDMEAVRRNVSGIVAASPVLLPLVQRVELGGGKVRTVQVMGVSEDYQRVRNLSLASGRFFDASDSQAHNKVGVMNMKLARQLYGSANLAVGKMVQLSGVPFVVIGTFRERVDTFGQTEVSDRTMLIPFGESRYLQDQPMVKQIFFSAQDASLVAPITEDIRRIIQSRHRPEAVYEVRNLTQLLSVAERTSNALTLLLLAVASVVLVVSGIGIMNIMFDTVRERIREIGIRRACGATRGDIALEFVSQAVVISLVGGVLGLLLGFVIPVLIRLFTPFYIPISGVAATVGILICSGIGILFGTVPAIRAAHLDPAESLRYQ